MTVSTKSERSEVDSTAFMGCATTRSLERVAASLGVLSEAPIQFEAAADVSYGGVLFALPALLVAGLLRHTQKHFTLPSGFYGIESIFLLLALMALARIKSFEGLRYTAPGEWGKLLGLDRIPEVKTLREKITQLCHESGQTDRWGTELAADWMAAEPESAGVFYADGHVRVYHGNQTQLPRRYITRERLCLRGTTDYWINALGGRPFFILTKEVDPGLVAMLRQEIVPWLKQQTPEPGVERHWFMLVFDREGYSPDFFYELKKDNIAILTYRKSVDKDWPIEEFQNYSVRLVSGETVQMKLAERGVLIGKLWLREIRKLTQTGHQTVILTTDYHSDMTWLAAAMFARWCQENFFKYMREHFNIDRLVEYSTEAVPDTTTVVNPRWRELDGAYRSKNGQLQRQLSLFGEVSFSEIVEGAADQIYQRRKGEIQENIVHLQNDIQQLKKQRKETQHYITVDKLEEKDRFSRLAKEKKHFIDTIKMIAYRAETAMADVVKEKLSRTADVRVFLRRLYETEADLKPDIEAKTLTVHLHHSSTQSHDETTQHLCDELNATETIFPGTHLKLIYKIGSS